MTKNCQVRYFSIFLQGLMARRHNLPGGREGDGAKTVSSFSLRGSI